MATHFKSQFTLVLITSLVFSLAILLLFFYFKNKLTATHTEVTDSSIIEKVSSMGKLELVKYEMKDVIEKKELHLLLPDSRILFLAAGEVTACIDLTKIKTTDITRSITRDTVTVVLPQPEICYARLDHQHSKVYDISGAWFPGNAANMVEEVYKIAEKRITDNARQMDVLGKARQNAQLIFKPLLESISGKTVILKFGISNVNPPAQLAVPKNN
jgi:hypothetical protein